MGLTNAQRQARHRDRLAEGRAEGVAQGAAILATLEVLTRAVEGLAAEVHSLGTGGGYVRQGGGKPARSVTSRAPNRAESLRNGEAARAYAGDGAPPPTGVVAPPTVSNDDDAHRVLLVLTRPGSAGSIRDALGAIGRDLSLDRVTAALVTLQGRGQVQRTPGEGPAPDVWEALPEDPALADLAEPIRRPPGPDQAATAHVECSAYSAHSTLGHRWDPVRSAFRCYVCDPEGRPDHAALANPTGQGGASLQEVSGP